MSPTSPARPRRHLVAAAAALALLGAACSGGPAARPAGGPPPAAPPNPSAPAHRGSLLPATPTELPEFDFARFRQLLAELRGTPVLVNVWASWCGPCYREAPVLARMARRYAGKVQFLGVDILDHRAPAREFIEAHGWTFPSVFDPERTIPDGLGLVGQPHTVIFDASGRQVFVWSGAVSEDVLERELARVAGG